MNTEQNRTEAKKKLPTQHWILQLEQSKSVENNQVEKQLHQHNKSQKQNTQKKRNSVKIVDVDEEELLVMVYSGFTQMLTGVDLLAKVKDLGDVSKTDLATQCGYVSQKKDGSDRVNFTAFYEALLNAKGIDLGGGAGGIGKGGRKLSYIAKVQGNGNLLIGKAYTAMLELNPGDNFTIKLGRKQIRLIPEGAEDTEE